MSYESKPKACLESVAKEGRTLVARGYILTKGDCKVVLRVASTKEPIEKAEIIWETRPDLAGCFDGLGFDFSKDKVGFTLRTKDTSMMLLLRLDAPEGRREFRFRGMRGRSTNPLMRKINFYRYRLIYNTKNYGLSDTLYRIREKIVGKEGRDRGYNHWRKKHLADHVTLRQEIAKMDEHLYAMRPSFGVILTDLPDGATKEQIVKYPFVRSLRMNFLKDYKLCRVNLSGSKRVLKKELSSIHEDYILFGRCRDILHETAVARLSSAILEGGERPDAVYTDEDTYTPRGEGKVDFSDPILKPDYSPEYQKRYNYIRRMTVVKKELLSEMIMEMPVDDAFAGIDPTSPEFIAGVEERAGRIAHVALPVYSVCAGEEEIVTDTAYVYPPLPRVTDEQLVSVIIPNKDHSEDLMTAIESTAAQSYKNLEFIIVENNSTEEETFACYEKLRARKDISVKVVTYRGGFNFSAINNLGVSEASGAYLLFLNNDVKFINPDSIREMYAHASRPEIGAVGARLYYEDGTLQHVGITLRLGGIAGHLYHGMEETEELRKSYTGITKEQSAVTAACMMMRKSVFRQAGGFEEGLAVAFNDADLCLKIRANGFKILYVAEATLYHYESKSRGEEDTPEKQDRFFDEIEYFSERWRKELLAGDPYYNPNRTVLRFDGSLRQ